MIKNFKKTIVVFLVFITLLSLTSFISVKNNKAFAETEQVKTTPKFVKYDDNFAIREDLNDIYVGDQNGRTMSVVITANNNTLVKPKGTKQKCTINCTWLGCDGDTDYAPFCSAKLTFTLYKYDGTSTTSKILDYTLTCEGDKWSEATKTYFKDAEKLNVRAKGLLDGGTNPFSEKDFSYQLELLVTTLKQDDNYKIEFSYDYKYYKIETGVGIPFAWHKHYFENHLKGNSILSNETGTIYDIFSKNVRKKYSNDSDLKTAYKDKLADYLIKLEKQYITKDITVSFLVPIETEENKNIPFAYKKTVTIKVVINSGRIDTNEVVSTLRKENYISEEYEKTLLKCFNSNVIIGDKLDETLDNKGHVLEYMLTYSSTYIIHLKSSSGGSNNFALKLTNMSDYYSEFCIGSNSSYSILDTDFYYAVYNNILNTYGLSGYKIPDGNNAGSVLTPSDLYGYWGFAIIPEGGGFDGLLSNFFDTRKNSNGLCIPFASDVTLDASGLLALQYDFGYSWLSRRLGDIVNSVFSSTTSNATFYMFYVAELSNDFVYVISENGNLEQLDTSSLTTQTIKKGANALSRGFKKVLGIFNNKVFLYILFGVVGFAMVLIVIKLFWRKN